MQALAEERFDLVVSVTYVPARLIVQGEGESTELELLSAGRSNYEGSALNRAANVDKAFADQLHGVVIPQGEDFSFNDTLVGSSGWHNAYVIVNGGDLVQEPGGGICQAATTAYRAALLAGVPIVKRKNHSLYVTYYEDYGVGLDATIYPGKQDLIFHNDTPGAMVMLARTHDGEGVVELYGTRDGRTVEMTGPYFADPKAQTGFTVEGRPLARNEIGWERITSFADGSSQREEILSRYLAIPKKLPQEVASGSRAVLTAVDGMF